MLFLIKKSFLLAGVLFFSYAELMAATKIWTGLAGDGSWSSPTNWSGNIIPASTDDVILDNSSAIGSYIVTLPNTPVTVRTITITPSGANIIQLVLPSSNTQSPALTATGPGYGLTINYGGIFKNSSGASNLTTVDIADSIRINDGGRFIHNTQRSHTSNVTVLSRMPGTEKGIFEFDVPGTQGYTVSISNRTYGTLVLHANSSPGGVKTYTGSGSNPLTINGDLQIGVGVTFKVDLATTKGNINLNGNFIQTGGTLNLASGPDSSILKIKGDMTQSSGAVVTESSTGLPAIELIGSSQQSISLQGLISDSIIFRMNNTGGAILQAPLSLPYKLDLVKGNITTSSVNLLTLQTKAVISTDSTNANTSFIIGPLRKEGLSSADHFLFPVGKTNEFRWLELKNATGNFNVEFISGNARDLGNSYSSGIDHISSHGYWMIDADASPAASANVELSFSNAGSSGVTDMATLRTSQFSSGVWLNRNNISTTGTPGASGSVVSEMITTFNSSSKDFVLASSVANENPLPVILISFNGINENDVVKLNWEVASSEDIDYFEIWSSDNSSDFKMLDIIHTVSNETKFEFDDKQMSNSIKYYKLRVIQKNGDSFFSKIISVENSQSPFKILSIAPSAVYDHATAFVYVNERTQLQLVVFGIDGKAIIKKYFYAERGRNSISCNFSGLAQGMYLLSCFDSKGNVGTIKFVKL
jgi:hypothetical protein